jgi:hypothetical protein
LCLNSSDFSQMEFARVQEAIRFLMKFPIASYWELQVKFSFSPLIYPVNPPWIPPYQLRGKRQVRKVNPLTFGEELNANTEFSYKPLEPIGFGYGLWRNDIHPAGYFIIDLDDQFSEFLALFNLSFQLSR